MGNSHVTVRAKSISSLNDIYVTSGGCPVRSSDMLPLNLQRAAKIFVPCFVEKKPFTSRIQLSLS